jgi:hypothetical protein
MEAEPCLYPIVSVGHMLRHPDAVTYLDGPTIISPGPNIPRLQSFDLVLLTNPVTIRKLSHALVPIATTGDYLLAAPDNRGMPPSPATSLPDNWRPISSQHLLDVTQDGTILFAFDPAPASQGDAVGIETHILTAPNSCYILKAKVQDRYAGSTTPWALVQQLVVNNVVIWDNDVSLGTQCGWNTIDHYIMPTGDHLEVQLRAVTLTGPEVQIDWPYASLTAIRGLTITPCP